MSQGRAKHSNPQDAAQRKRTNQQRHTDYSQKTWKKTWQKRTSGTTQIVTPLNLCIEGQIDIHICTYDIVYLSVSFCGFSVKN
jgi:hypothetical protein